MRDILINVSRKKLEKSRKKWLNARYCYAHTRFSFFFFLNTIEWLITTPTVNFFFIKYHELCIRCWKISLADKQEKKFFKHKSALEGNLKSIRVSSDWRPNVEASPRHCGVEFSAPASLSSGIASWIYTEDERNFY